MSSTIKTEVGVFKDERETDPAKRYKMFFCGEPQNTPAVITTQPLTFSDPSVGITADVWSDGSVRVSVLDNAGNQRAVSKPIRTTGTDSHVEWETSQDLTGLSGDQVRLRFQLHNAKLYAFQIGT